MRARVAAAVGDAQTGSDAAKVAPRRLVIRRAAPAVGDAAAPAGVGSVSASSAPAAAPALSVADRKREKDAAVRRARAEALAAAAAAAAAGGDALPAGAVPADAQRCAV
jgi:hypothetical protein